MRPAFLVLPALILSTPIVLASDLLTVTDVEKVSGLSGLHAVPKNPGKGAGGDLNFAGSDDKLVVMVTVQKAAAYQSAKKAFFHEAVPGVGDEAFLGPNVPQPYMINFRKGDASVAISSFFDKAGKARLTAAQLTKLAQLAASRL
jgi:hypothetical protein